MAKKSTAPAAAPQEQRPTRELWRFVDFYNKNVRAHSKEECMGVIRQIQRLIDKGLGVEDLATALENYAADEWRKAQEPRYSKPIRSFFTYEVVKEWLTPKKKPVRPDPLKRVTAFQTTEMPKPVSVELDDPVDPVSEL